MFFSKTIKYSLQFYSIKKAPISMSTSISDDQSPRKTLHGTCRNASNLSYRQPQANFTR